MSDSQALLIETAERLFAELAAESGADYAKAWGKVEAVGLPALLVPEADGGFGGDWEDAFAVARLAGAHAVALPIGETIAAAWLGARADMSATEGVVTLAPICNGALDAKQRFSGRVEAAPWGENAASVLADCDGGLIKLAVRDAKSIARRLNPAGEPRDTLVFDSAPSELSEASMSVVAAGALIRTAQMAGALDAALALSIAHANERIQFGKAIGKFQAVQQSLAMFAEEAAAVNCGGQAAARAAARDDAWFEIAAAKLRANIAAGIGAAAAHQVHGAIGFTQAHALHRLTRRLAAWRSEFGGDATWSARLGVDVCKRGADGLWPHLTSRSDFS